MKFSVLVRGSVLFVVALAASSLAQDSDTQGSSLGDVARQSRAQHAGNDAKSSKAQDMVDEMQREQEESDNAPLGYKSYNAGEYRLLVPFPYSLEGRDNGGPVLLGSRLGITNTEVMAGAPISLDTSVSDGELVYIARQLAGLHGQYPSCSVTKLGERKAIRCAWNGSPRLLGREVWGTMEFVVTSGSLIPVMCVSADEMQCVSYSQGAGFGVCNKPGASADEVKKTMADQATRFRDELTTAQVCDQIIYPSIHLKEDTVVHPAKVGEAKKAAAPTGPALQQATITTSSDEQSESLGAMARKTRQVTRTAAHAKLDNSEGGGIAPPGFQAQMLQFCLNPQVCGEASVIVPEKAQVLSSVNGQYIFKTMQNGSPVMLYAGLADVNAPYRSMTNPDYIRMRDSANNGWSGQKPDEVSMQEITVEGYPAVVTRFRYQRDKDSWIGERTLVDFEGAQFLLACTAPEPHFAEAEQLCTTLVNSFRLP